MSELPVFNPANPAIRTKVIYELNREEVEALVRHHYLHPTYTIPTSTPEAFTVFVTGAHSTQEREVLAAYYEHSADTIPAETVPAVDLLLDGLVALGVLPAGIYELTFGDPQPGAIVDAPAQ